MTTHFTLNSRLIALGAKTTHLDLLVRLPTDPSETAAVRPSLNLALVIDKSGSMTGRPLEEAKLAAIHLIKKLQPGDQVCVIAYATHVELMAAPMDAAEGRAQLLAAVSRIQSQGSTALHAGWLHGAQALAPFVSRFGISRVLLLSDGQATDGIRDPVAIAAEAAELAAAGITTSTYGLGLNFNEDLMTALAKSGGGQAFYAETADALIPYFESEFAMLSATVGRNVQITLKAVWKAGKGKSKPLLPVVRLEDMKALKDGKIGVSPLVAGAESWAAVRVDLATLPASGTLTIEASAHWEDMAGTAHVAHAEASVPVKAKEMVTKDTVVLERLKEVDAARVQQEALREARAGNWDASDHLIRSLSATAGSNAYVAGVASSLSALSASRNLGEFSKEVTYSSHSMTNRVVESDEDVNNLGESRFGLRKAMQGKVATGKKEG